VKGLANGTAYTCEVAADTATKQGDWTKSDDTVTPAGPVSTVEAQRPGRRPGDPDQPRR
jgi:hypothetical protein